MKSTVVPPVNVRLCRRAGALALASAIAFLLGNAALWLTPQWTELAARMQAELTTEPVTITAGVRSLGLGLSSAGLALLAWGLLSARGMFLRLADGDAFREESAALLRRFGLALLCYAGFLPVETALMGWIVTMHNPPGQTIVRLGISDEHVVLALVGTLILVLGSVLADAARLAEENRQIV